MRSGSVPFREQAMKRRWVRGSLQLLIVTVLVLLTVEVGFRGYLALRIGPSILFYGTSFGRTADGSAEHSTLLRSIYHRRMRGTGEEFHNIRQHEQRAENYSKYRPHQIRYTYDAITGEVYEASINGRGFRGSDFADQKLPGVVRVVALGASSTFGYHNRDDLTYPAQLERMLDERCPKQDFEVINLGIPHLLSDEIVALFLAEGLPLSPDVVTFYEGFNDSGSGATKTRQHAAERSALKRLHRWTRERFVIVAFVDSLVSERTKRFSSQQLEAHMAGKAAHFIANLDLLADAAEEVGAKLLVARQQARSLLVLREDLPGVRFHDEIDLVREKLAHEGWLSRDERNFLTYELLLDALEPWASERGVTVVDTLGALDPHREEIVSWVHLSHEGNRIIADTLASAILELKCPPPTSTASPPAHTPLER